jgi:hypothetical protein
MMKMWGNFARTGNPTPTDGAWRAWDSVAQSKMNFNQVSLKRSLQLERMCSDCGGFRIRCR